MIGAGNNYQSTQTAQQGQQTNPYMQGGGMAPPSAMGPSFQPTFGPQWTAPTSAPGINFKAELGTKESAEAMRWGFGTQIAGMAVNTILQGLNYDLAAKSMKYQASIANKYYETQGTIAGYQKEVAIAQLGVQKEGMGIQQEMHAAQLDHEKSMARLAGNTQARLKMIEDRGKTNRAKILTVSNAFDRRGWSNYGTPRAA